MAAAQNLTTEILPVSQDWKDLLEEILPPQGEWSEDQFLVLTDDSRRLIEFTDGFLEVLPMPTDHHQVILEFLFLALRQFIKPRGGKVLFAPLRLRIRPRKYREPDILLLQAASDPRRQNRFWTGADVAMEIVSADKPERDLVHKRTDYAEGGIQEYWIVNPVDESITILTLQGAAYVEAGRFRRGQTAASVLLSGFAVEVASVFDAD